MKQKGKFFQWFCKHNNANWYKEETKFQVLSGERRYLICDNCGKILDTCFVINVDDKYM